MYETFDHTADLGLRARAADLDTLFAEMALALSAALVEDIATVAPAREVRIDLPADDVEYLLFDWLKALLYHFETAGVVGSRFEVAVTPTGLSGRAFGEPVDEARHALAHEVKAVTYHGLRVERIDGDWLAEVIVDI